MTSKKAIILAGGKGTRLRPITDEIPKALVEIGESTILERQIRQFTENNIDDIVVVTGYKSSMIDNVIDELSEEYRPAIHLIKNERYENTDNGYSLYCALQEIGSDPFIVINGDVVCHSAIIEIAAKEYTESIAFYDSTNFESDELKLELGGGSPTGILDQNSKNAVGATIDTFVFNASASASLFDELESLIESGGENEWFEYALDNIMGSIEFDAIDISEYWWIDIDTEDNLEQVSTYLN